MADSLTRRDFLKISAVAASATVVSGCTIDLQQTEYLESYVKPPEDGLPGENLWYATTCRQCSAGCGIVVRVSDGRARKIEGNPQHPVNQGKLCARGQAALQELYDPDRLRNAVQQTGGRASQVFEPLQWDLALPMLLSGIIAADPAKVAFLGGNISSHLWVVVSRFMEALGGGPPVIYSLGDELEGRAALAQSSQQMFGAKAIPLFDIANADVVFSFGANFLETWLSPVHYARAYGQMRRGPLGKRGYVVQLEPRLSSTAASADEWVPVHPGTEGLVALAIGKIIVEEGLANAPNAELFKPVSVASVAQVSGVPAEVLERLARLLASVSRPLALAGGAALAHGNGVAVASAIQALNQALGHVGQPGGVFLPGETTSDEFAPPPISKFADVQRLIEDMDAGEVQVLLIHGANPVFDLPGAAGFTEALANVDFVASFSPVVDETAVHSDLIVPDHTSLEGWGYHVPAIANRSVISGQQPVMRPLYDTRSVVDVFLSMAKDLGGPVASALPWPNEIEFLKDMLAQRNGAGWSEALWSSFRRRGGDWSQVEDRSSPASGQRRAEPLSLSAPGDDPNYPFHLHLYPSITLFDGRGANKSWLQETPDPMTTVTWQTWIEINPLAAERLGVKDNDIVLVISPAGQIEAVVYVYHGVGEDVVAMPIGQGHEHYGRYAAGQGSNPVQLLVPEMDSDTGGLAWAATRVMIVPTGHRHALARLESPEGVEYLRGGH